MSFASGKWLGAYNGAPQITDVAKESATHSFMICQRPYSDFSQVGSSSIFKRGFVMFHSFCSLSLGASLPHLFEVAVGSGASWLGCYRSRPVPWPDGNPARRGPSHCCTQLSSALPSGVSLSAPVLKACDHGSLYRPAVCWFRSWSGSSATTLDLPEAIHVHWWGGHLTKVTNDVRLSNDAFSAANP